MALPITFNNTVFQAGFFGTDDGGVPTNATRSFRIDDTYDFPVTVNGTVTDSNSTVTLTYTLPGSSTPTTQTLNATNLDNPDMILFTGSGVPGNQDGSLNRYVFSNVQMYGNPPPAGQTRTTFADDGNGALGEYAAPVCFTTGTLIRTSRGDIAIESLSVGDLAVTASGEHRPIRWIGSRRMDCRRHPNPTHVMPVRIRAGALGINRPARDLLVSPGHSIAFDLLGEILVPASALINGCTIVQEDVESITYWHVELETHDLILAEGQAVESYLEMGNRTFFGGGSVIDLSALPAAISTASRTHADFCRPFYDNGAFIEVVRTQLRARAEALGWMLVTPGVWEDVYLEVDGRIVRPRSEGLSASFEFTADAREIWLVSATSVPAYVDHNSDGRTLGLCLSGLSLGDGATERRAVPLDDPLLCIGFHTLSPGHRWTTGRAKLPHTLTSGMHGQVTLHIEQGKVCLPRWVFPDVDLSGHTALEDLQLRAVA
jgi:hypothetical protein